jgi:hypothetical protein
VDRDGERKSESQHGGEMEDEARGETGPHELRYTRGNPGKRRHSQLEEWCPFRMSNMQGAAPLQDTAAFADTYPLRTAQITLDECFGRASVQSRPPNPRAGALCCGCRCWRGRAGIFTARQRFAMPHKPR